MGVVTGPAQAPQPPRAGGVVFTTPASLAHRLTEIARRTDPGAPPVSAHVLVLLDIEMRRPRRRAHVLQAAGKAALDRMPEGAVPALMGPGRIAVLTRRTPSLARRLEALRMHLRLSPDLEGRSTWVWVERVPHDQDAVDRFVTGLVVPAPRGARMTRRARLAAVGAVAVSVAAAAAVVLAPGSGGGPDRDEVELAAPEPRPGDGPGQAPLSPADPGEPSGEDAAPDEVDAPGTPSGSVVARTASVRREGGGSSGAPAGSPPATTSAQPTPAGAAGGTPATSPAAGAPAAETADDGRVSRPGRAEPRGRAVGHERGVRAGVAWARGHRGH